ncbi:hypothetical protein OIV83_000800 [Microbotryomycetes sp. JL201]|nr:hypothetical protein OIV83_000800 [Microbotryomycetes sp. JL201]
MSAIFSDQLLAIVCWSFLPSFATKSLLRAYYFVAPHKRPRPIASRSSESDNVLRHELERAVTHAKYARAILVCGYILWTLATEYSQLYAASNYYSLLGLTREAVDTSGSALVKGQFRRLARIYHPDKVGPQGEALFVELKKGADVLENDVKRWAYERFGPRITTWGPKLASRREFLVAGLPAVVIFYTMAFASSFVAAVFNSFSKRQRFWQWWGLSLALFVELNLVISVDSSSPTRMTSYISDAMLRFQLIEVVRKLWLAYMIALNQLGPLWSTSSTDLLQDSSIPQDLRQRLRLDEELGQLKPVLQRMAGQIDSARRFVDSFHQDLVQSASVPVPEGDTVETYRTKIIKTVGQELKEGYRDLLVRLPVNDESSRAWTDAVKRAYINQSVNRVKAGRQRIRNEYQRAVHKLVERHGSDVVEDIKSPVWLHVRERFRGTPFSDLKLDSNQRGHFDVDGRCAVKGCRDCRQVRRCRACTHEVSSDEHDSDDQVSDTDDQTQKQEVEDVVEAAPRKLLPHEVPLPPSPPPSPPLTVRSLPEAEL